MITTQNSKGILLDIDNTLYPYPPAHTAALEAVFTKFQSTLNCSRSEFDQVYARARDVIHERLEGTAASHHRLLYFQHLCEFLTVNPLPHAAHMTETYWSTFLQNMSFFDGATAFLEFVRDKKICLITDLVADIQYRKVEQLGLSTYTSCMVTSEEAGVEKPDPRIFTAALEKIGLGAEEVIMIGDDLTRDVRGALRSGIPVIWFKGNADLLTDEECAQPIYIVSSFEEIITLLSHE